MLPATIEASTFRRCRLFGFASSEGVLVQIHSAIGNLMRQIGVSSLIMGNYAFHNEAIY